MYNIGNKESLAVSAREKSWELSERVDGWTKGRLIETFPKDTTDLGGEAVLEWREAEQGAVERDDGVSPSVGWRCWRLKAQVAARKETLINMLMDWDNMAEWNSSLTKTKVLARPSEDLMLTYQVTDGQRPLVSPRDFVSLVSVTEKEGAWICGGCSISLDSFPPSSQHVRAWQYPTGMIVRPDKSSAGMIELCWVLQCDYSGDLPPSLLNFVMPYAIKLFLTSVREGSLIIQL